MPTLKLLFGIHNHQPVGNFDHVFEDVFQKSYRPYFEVLQDFPSLKTAAHFSGPLLEWLKKNHPDYLKMLRDFCVAGRLEILSGGFYEPILSSIPEDDAVGQIRMMNEFIEHEFGKRPRGLWLAERIWTPSLPKTLAQAGIEYTVLDDTHFYYAGLQENEIGGYFVTEYQGFPLRVFPISKTLRYAIPFDLPEVTLEHLRKLKDQHAAVTYADDGEKFGSWPDTYQWVFEEEYLRKWFAALAGQTDWLETMTFSEYLDSHAPTGRVYLPMASYDEMMEWSLPTGVSRQFVDFKKELRAAGFEETRSRVFLRGGQWENFLTKYSEANQMHKKMIHVSRKVARIPQTHPRASEAQRELYRGQCNCAQWHGLFGGLYLNYLRHALYAHLIAAENIADEILLGKDRGLNVEVLDFNLDGFDEVLVSNSKLSAGITPAYGGALFELDYRSVCFNLSNVLRRREETYHAQFKNDDSQEVATGEGPPQSIHDRVRSKEQGLADKLFYDSYERYSFLDHFLPLETSLEQFKQSRYEELGDFVDQPFTFEKPASQSTDATFNLHLKRAGRVRQEVESVAVAVEKTFSFSPRSAEIEVRYKITNGGTRSVDALWAVEFNFTLLAGDAGDRYYLLPGSERPRMATEGILDSAPSIGFRDDWHGFELMLSLEPAPRLWRFPVATVSQSEAGLESNYQGSCLLPHWELHLPAGAVREFKIGLTLS